MPRLLSPRDLGTLVAVTHDDLPTAVRFRETGYDADAVDALAERVATFRFHARPLDASELEGTTFPLTRVRRAYACAPVDALVATWVSEARDGVVAVAPRHAAA